MAKHRITFDIPAQIMGNVDITCHPSSDVGGKIGTLKLSKGTVDWTPAHKSVNFRRFSWEKFAELLEHGVVRRRPVAKRRRRRAS